MPPLAQPLSARSRWSIVFGACMTSVTLVGAAAALWLSRPEISCHGGWEQVAEGVEHRRCERRQRMGDGELTAFRELRIQPPGQPSWFLERTDISLVERTGELVLVRERDGGNPWLGDEHTTIVAYRFRDGERLWATTIQPWVPYYEGGVLSCLPPTNAYENRLLAELDGTLIYLGSGEGSASVIGIDVASGATRWERELDSLGLPGEPSVQAGVLLIPSRDLDVLYRVDAEGGVTMSSLPMRSAASCLERARHTHPLDSEMTEWLEDGEARLDCMPAGPRTLIVARAGSRMRVLLLSPDGEVRFVDERSGVEVRIPFDNRCTDLFHGPLGTHRTIAWLERAHDEPWELVLLDTRLRHELRFGLPGWEPGRVEIVPWRGGWYFEGAFDGLPYHSFGVGQSAPHIATHTEGPIRFEPRDDYGDDIMLPYGPLY